MKRFPAYMFLSYHEDYEFYGTPSLHLRTHTYTVYIFNQNYEKVKGFKLYTLLLLLLRNLSSKIFLLRFLFTFYLTWKKKNVRREIIWSHVLIIKKMCERYGKIWTKKPYFPHLNCFVITGDNLFPLRILC